MGNNNLNVLEEVKEICSKVELDIQSTLDIKDILKSVLDENEKLTD